MIHRHAAWAAALVVPVAALLAWQMRAAPTLSDPRDTIRVVAGRPPHVVAAAATLAPPPPTAPKRLAIVATQEDIDRSNDQSLAIASEARDPAWATRSEAVIERVMRRIAYVGGERRLDIHCAASLCEVVGLIDPDPVSSYRSTWDALERDTATNDLRAQGLVRVAAIFDTGRVPEEFRIQYRRTDAAARPDARATMSPG